MFGLTRQSVVHILATVARALVYWIFGALAIVLLILAINLVVKYGWLVVGIVFTVVGPFVVGWVFLSED